jgi:branched-chain amino acid transport system permease protein
MTGSSEILQYALSGITVGSTYAIIAMGFNIIFNASTIINLAQGEFVMLGGMTTMYMYRFAHLPMPVAVIVAILVVTWVGAAMERAAINTAKSATVTSLIIITVGASIFLRGVAMLVWGKDSYIYPSFSGDQPIIVGGATILPQAIWILAITTAVMILMRLFFNRTLIGKAMLACASNPGAALLVGIDVKFMTMLSFAISGGMGAIAGIILTPITLTSYDVGVMLGLKGFSAAVLGGLGSGGGSIIGGLVLGIMESFGAGFISSAYKDAIAFIVMLIVLFVRPSGIMGSKEVKRV